MFVAALSHDADEESRKCRAGSSAANAGNVAQRSGVAGASNSSGAVAQQLLLLSEAAEFRPAQA
jgi:hypothetical protein